jgi:hypothetical protein
VKPLVDNDYRDFEAISRAAAKGGAAAPKKK